MEISKVNYEFKKEIVVKIIAEFKKQLKNNSQLLNKSISTDKKLSLAEFDINLLMKAFENTYIPIEQSNTSVTDGIGTIGVIYNGNPYITLYLSLCALKTHNNIVFFVNDSMIATNQLLVGMLNKIIEQYSYGKNIITLCNNTPEKEIIESQNLLNTIIFVGSKYEYFNFSKKVYIPIIYNGYENVIFYIDSQKDFEKELIEINSYVYEHNIKVETYRKNPKISIEQINENPNNELVVLFTKDKTLAKDFINNVKCRKLIINQNPFENYLFELDENVLVVKKQIIF